MNVLKYAFYDSVPLASYAGQGRYPHHALERITQATEQFFTLLAKERFGVHGTRQDWENGVQKPYWKELSSSVWITELKHETTHVFAWNLDDARMSFDYGKSLDPISFYRMIVRTKSEEEYAVEVTAPQLNPDAKLDISIKDTAEEFACTQRYHSRLGGFINIDCKEELEIDLFDYWQQTSPPPSPTYSNAQIALGVCLGIGTLGLIYKVGSAAWDHFQKGRPSPAKLIAPSLPKELGAIRNALGKNCLDITQHAGNSRVDIYAEVSDFATTNIAGLRALGFMPQEKIFSGRTFSKELPNHPVHLHVFDPFIPYSLQSLGELAASSQP